MVFLDMCARRANGDDTIAVMASQCTWQGRWSATAETNDTCRLSPTVQGKGTWSTAFSGLWKIRAIDAREIRERCDHAIKREALDMKKAGMFRNPVVVAIDEHLVGWYGKDSDSQYITRSKSKNGTSRFYSLATAHCVAGGSRAALGVRLVKKTDNDGDVVSKLRERLRGLSLQCTQLRTTP